MHLERNDPMNLTSEKSHAVLDGDDVGLFLFHPRKDYGSIKTSSNAKDVRIEVDPGVEIGARFHFSGPSCPNILFFHGNGEIVSDYDPLGDMYTKMDINFWIFDYRGYGWSTGRPSASSMMHDCHVIFEYADSRLKAEKFSGPIYLMGRSLGSASAIEVAAAEKTRIQGLIVESGFAYTMPLLARLGADIQASGISEAQGFKTLEKIKTVFQPVLIIHAEQDHIIPFSDGLALYDACPAAEKIMVKIPGADHNTIFRFGLSAYMNAVKRFVANS
jgi:pimeloyl-ACP methyl ester carboxylesterase